MTLQDELFFAVKDKYPQAEAKKINVDNYLDIHIPDLNKKRGTHLWCNTAKNEIKIGFYCRDIEFTEDVISRSTKIEKYSQGFRELGNPAHQSVEKAIVSIWEFTNQITRTQGSSSTPIKIETEPLLEVQNSNSKIETEIFGDPINEFNKELEAYKNKDFAKAAEYVKAGNVPLEFHNKILIEDYLLTLVIGGNLNQEKLHYLVTQNYNLDVRNNENDLLTACHFASDSNQVEVLEMLINAGANPDLTDKTGNTPLHLAVKNKDIKCVKLLIDKKVDLDKKVKAEDIITEGKTGTTALRYAVLKQLWNISDLLIEAGANLENLKDPCLNGENFFDAIKKYQNEHLNFSEIKINDLENKVFDKSNSKTSVYKGSESIVKEIVIGNQVWTKENLNVEKFKNGDLIPFVETDKKWQEAGENEQPAWCYYNNDASNGKKYGKLYNWYAINDPRGLAPEGWHIPSDKEWTILEEYLDNVPGTKLKNSNGWAGDDSNGTNESGFSGLPGGWRKNESSFSGIGTGSFFWTSKEHSDDSAFARDLDAYGEYTFEFPTGKGNGLSVRCLKD